MKRSFISIAGALWSIAALVACGPGTENTTSGGSAGTGASSTGTWTGSVDSDMSDSGGNETPRPAGTG